MTAGVCCCFKLSQKIKLRRMGARLGRMMVGVVLLEDSLRGKMPMPGLRKNVMSFQGRVSCRYARIGLKRVDRFCTMEIMGTQAVWNLEMKLDHLHRQVRT